MAGVSIIREPQHPYALFAPAGEQPRRVLPYSRREPPLYSGAAENAGRAAGELCAAAVIWRASRWHLCRMFGCHAPVYFPSFSSSLRDVPAHCALTGGSCTFYLKDASPFTGAAAQDGAGKRLSGTSGTAGAELVPKRRCRFCRCSTSSLRKGGVLGFRSYATYSQC